MTPLICAFLRRKRSLMRAVAAVCDCRGGLRSPRRTIPDSNETPVRGCFLNMSDAGNAQRSNPMSEDQLPPHSPPTAHLRSRLRFAPYPLQLHTHLQHSC